MKFLLPSLLALLSLPLIAQTPAPLPVTQVLVQLVVKPGVAREDVMKVMREEVKATVQLYLDGKIQQWYGREDGRGVVLILNAKSVAEAKAITESLPLHKTNLADFEYQALRPLGPLRMLLDDGAGKK